MCVKFEFQVNSMKTMGVYKHQAVLASSSVTNSSFASRFARQTTHIQMSSPIMRKLQLNCQIQQLLLLCSPAVFCVKSRVSNCATFMTFSLLKVAWIWCMVPFTTAKIPIIYILCQLRQQLRQLIPLFTFMLGAVMKLMHNQTNCFCFCFCFCLVGLVFLFFFFLIFQFLLYYAGTLVPKNHKL